MKRAAFVVLTMILSVALGIGTYGIVMISYDNQAAKKAAKTGSATLASSTTTTSPVMQETSTTSTTFLFNRGESTTVPEKDPLDSTTTTTTVVPDESTANCDDISLLDYWRNASVEDIEAFIAKIPQTRRWIITCGEQHPIQALEMRDWVRVRLSL